MCKAVSHECIQGISDFTSLQIEDLSKPYNSWTTNPNWFKFSAITYFHLQNRFISNLQKVFFDVKFSFNRYFQIFCLKKRCFWFFSFFDVLIKWIENSTPPVIPTHTFISFLDFFPTHPNYFNYSCILDVRVNIYLNEKIGKRSSQTSHPQIYEVNR